MKALGAELARLVDYTEASLATISDPESQVPLRTGGWSRKQLIGHLIDSASNNHQRFVRAALQSPCRIGSGEPVTLEFLAVDYLRHLVHHLQQMK